MTRILIAGDLIVDNNLVLLPEVNQAHSGLLPRAVIGKRKGDAWFLRWLKTK